MFRFKAMLMTCLAAAAGALPAAAQADDQRSVACNVAVSFLLNGTVRHTYEKAFVIAPGGTFDDDFSTAIRFRYFTARQRLEADKSIVVTVGYYNDVGVFDFMDFNTQLTLREDRLLETNAGRYSYFTSQGAPGERTIDYALICSRVKP